MRVGRNLICGMLLLGLGLIPACRYHWPPVETGDGTVSGDADPGVDVAVGDSGPGVDAQTTDGALPDAATVDSGTDGAVVPVCGDGILSTAAGEECDDGNLRSHDGCSSGCTDETPTWSVLSTITNPPSIRYGMAMSYDTLSQRIQVHGGRDCCDYFDDTWWLEDAEWINVVLGTAPSTRAFHRMAFDQMRAVTVLFGGDPFGNDLDDTWEFNGLNWSQTNPPSDPGPSSHYAMVYFGPISAVLLWNGDTYAYNGAWNQLSAGAGPSWRERAAMAWDQTRHVAVLHGGGFGNSAMADTWEFDGTTWTDVSATMSPTGRKHHGLVYQPRRERLLMYGGLDATNAPIDETWEYDGTTWTLLTVAGNPPPRYGFGMVYDRAHARVVLFGGKHDYFNSPSEHNDTWVFRWESSWPDELCDTAGDEDTDGLADCADPDCDLRPCGSGNVCVGGSCQ